MPHMGFEITCIQIPICLCDETYDVVVIGGGFSGTTAAYEFNKQRKQGQTCLVLENHPIFGGEAKQNEFDVDGHRLVAPQGSNGALAVKEHDHITGRYEVYAEYYRELGMPSHYDLEPLAGGAEKYTLPNDHFDPMLLERKFPTGYYFKGHGWTADPIASGFANTPWPAAVRKEIDDFANNRRDVISRQADADRWLDSISYFELLDKLGYGVEVKNYINPLLGVGNFGVCGNAVSAYAARRLTLPGTIPSNTPNRFVDVSVVSFPGGNAAILRKMWARMLPEAISGDGSLQAVATGAVNFSALDREGAPVRLRLQSTAVHIRHDGSESVLVTYVQAGKLYRVRAKAVVMGSGGWVNRNIVHGPAELACASVRAISLRPGADGQRRRAPLAIFRQVGIHRGALVLWVRLARMRPPQRGSAARDAAADSRQSHRPDILYSDSAARRRSDRAGARRTGAAPVHILCAV